MTFYSTLMETMRLSCSFSSYSELFVKSRLFEPISHMYLTLQLGWPRSNLA